MLVWLVAQLLYGLHMLQISVEFTGSAKLYEICIVVFVSCHC